MSDILIGLYANFLHRLLDIAGKRDFIPAPEVAQVLNVASQTARKKHSLIGRAYGIGSTKIGNRLLWSVAQIANKLRGAL